MLEKFLIHHVPGTLLCVGIVVLVVGLSLLGLAVVRRSVELRQLRSLHDVAGFILAVVGILYGVLLGFTVIIQWEQYTSAVSDASDEAGSVSNLYRDAVALGPAGGPRALRLMTTPNNSPTSTTRTWPSIWRAIRPSITRSTRLLTAVIKLRENAPKDSFFVDQAVEDVSAVSQGRRTRIEVSSETLPGPLWLALLAGGLLTIGFTFFFGLESFAAQAIMVSALAVIIALCLFVILDFDLPFSGQDRDSAHRAQVRPGRVLHVRPRQSAGGGALQAGLGERHARVGGEGGDASLSSSPAKEKSSISVTSEASTARPTRRRFSRGVAHQRRSTSLRERLQPGLSSIALIGPWPGSGSDVDDASARVVRASIALVGLVRAWATGWVPASCERVAAPLLGVVNVGLGGLLAGPWLKIICRHERGHVGAVVHGHRRVHSDAGASG